MTAKNNQNPRMEEQATKGKAIIDKYVPSNLSDEQRLKQAISNNPNTMGSVEDSIKDFGSGRTNRPTSGK